MTTKQGDRLFYVAGLLLILALVWALLEAFAPSAAQSATLRIVPVVPTVPGIEASPSPAPFYARGPVVRRAPSSEVIELREPAPANRCGPHAFEVISGPQSGRGCFGSN